MVWCELRVVFFVILCVEQVLFCGGDIVIYYDNGWQIIVNVDVIDVDLLLWELMVENEVLMYVLLIIVFFVFLL